MCRRVPNNTNNEEENTTHIYDEIKRFSVNCSKATDGKYSLDHEVIFDTATDRQQPPTYELISTKTTCNDKLKCSKCNDYYIIKDETMCLKKEDCCTSNNEHCTPSNQA